MRKPEWIALAIAALGINGLLFWAGWKESHPDPIFSVSPEVEAQIKREHPVLTDLEQNLSWQLQDATNRLRIVTGDKDYFRSNFFRLENRAYIETSESIPSDKDLFEEIKAMCIAKKQWPWEANLILMRLEGRHGGDGHTMSDWSIEPAIGKAIRSNGTWPDGTPFSTATFEFSGNPVIVKYNTNWIVRAEK